MKYTVKLDRKEFYLLLGALRSDAGKLDKLAQSVSDKELSRQIASLARDQRDLYRKIMDTYKILG